MSDLTDSEAEQQIKEVSDTICDALVPSSDNALETIPDEELETAETIKGKRSTRQEVNERELEVADYLLHSPMASEFDLHKEFCPKYSVTWSRINAYTHRAREINRKRIDIPPEDYKRLGQAILLDLLKSPSAMIRIKAEQALRDIAGYGAPKVSQIGGLDGHPLTFVPLQVNPDEITGITNK